LTAYFFAIRRAQHRKYAVDDQGLQMTVELNTSAVYANTAREAQYVQLQQEQTSIVGLSLAQKETFNLARTAETGDSVWDKVILNLVHPPALTLFALLDSGRRVAAPPLPQVQEAYDTIAKTAKETDTKTTNPDTGSEKTAVTAHVSVAPVTGQVSAPTQAVSTTPASTQTATATITT
jgi:hypothetical protein